MTKQELTIKYEGKIAHIRQRIDDNQYVDSRHKSILINNIVLFSGIIKDLKQLNEEARQVKPFSGERIQP